MSSMNSLELSVRIHEITSSLGWQLHRLYGYKRDQDFVYCRLFLNPLNSMKALRILFLMLALPIAGYGQIYVDGALIDTLNTPYCQLICTNATGLSNTRVRIDYGQRFVNNLLGRQKITGENREAIIFNSSIDALNFMSKQGWVLVSS